MKKTFTEGVTYENKNFIANLLVYGDYEDCVFNNCNFSDSDLSGYMFSGCTFNGCNLSLVKITLTSFQDVTFKNCKILGLHFDDCNKMLFSVEFDNCSLNVSSFYKLKMRKTIFKNSSVCEADFTEADLSNSVFDNCDLTRTTFRNTNIERVDFLTSYNFRIDLEVNSCKKAKFSLSGLAGLLEKYDIEIL